MRQREAFPAAVAGTGVDLQPTRETSFGALALGLTAGVVLALVSACSSAPKATNEDGSAKIDGQTELDSEQAPLEEAYTTYFAFNSDRLDEKARTVIADAVVSAKDARETKIVISGHSDRQGSADYNRRLSESRVEAVASAFVEAGFPLSKIELQVFGEEQPRQPTPDGQALAENRRAEITLLKTLDTPADTAAEAQLEVEEAAQKQTCDYIYIWSGDRAFPFCLEKRTQATPQPR